MNEMHNSACCGAETSIRLHPSAKACPQPGGRLCGQRCLPSLTVWLLARPHQLLAEGKAAQRAFHCPRDTERTSVCLSCTTTPHRCSQAAQASLREDALTSDPSGGGDQTAGRHSQTLTCGCGSGGSLDELQVEILPRLDSSSVLWLFRSLSDAS